MLFSSPRERNFTLEVSGHIHISLAKANFAFGSGRLQLALFLLSLANREQRIIRNACVRADASLMSL